MLRVLTKPQLDTVSEIFVSAGQVFLATLVGLFISGFDRSDIQVLLSALGLTIYSWITAVKIKKIRRKK